MQNNKMRNLVNAALVCCIAISGSAGAFSVLRLTRLGVEIPISFADGNHEKMTTDVLRGYSTKLENGTTVQFDQSVYEIVWRANRFTDSVYVDLTEVHFDRENFAMSVARLDEHVERIASRIKDNDFKNAQLLLGSALHTVQDFYAHSTWVEQGKKKTAPMDASMANQTFFAAPCTRSGLDSSLPLTSGFFNSWSILPDSPAINNSFVHVENANLIENSYFLSSGKCRHGSSSDTSGTSGGAGINKDTARRDKFEDAYFLASVGTYKYINRVVAKAKEIGVNDNQICGFLGQSEETVPGCGKPKQAQNPWSWICPGRFVGTETNPDSPGGAWTVDLDFTSCSTKYEGKLTEVRGTDKQVRTFTASEPVFGVMEMTIDYPTVLQGSGIPCTGMKAKLTSEGNTLVGRWTATNCPQGGEFVLSRGKK